jgi:hypothetical protein
MFGIVDGWGKDEWNEGAYFLPLGAYFKILGKLETLFQLSLPLSVLSRSKELIRPESEGFHSRACYKLSGGLPLEAEQGWTYQLRISTTSGKQTALDSLPF